MPNARNETPIVQPPPRGSKPPLPPWVVMAATGPDLRRLRRGLDLAEEPGEPLYTSGIYRPGGAPAPFCLVGPFLGAPQAAMLMETTSAWGGTHYLFIGWCGAIDARVQTGDILLPTAAFIDEGTSPGYGVPRGQIALPSPELHRRIKALLEARELPFREGAVWSTDAVFRETPSKVRAHLAKGALAVEMEISACFTVAHLRGLHFAALLVVSDELSSLEWRPGFRDPRFRETCRAVSRIVEDLCRNL